MSGEMISEPAAAAELATSSPLFSSSSELAASLDSYEDDIASWINDLLDVQEAESNASSSLTALDRQVQQLATKLDVASQDTSQQLEQAIDDISRTIPRLTYDLQYMRESAVSLQEALQTIEKRGQPALPPPPNAQGKDENTMSTTQVLEKLYYLDTVKTALEKTYSVLREAEAWSTLDSEITTLLSSQSYAPAASRLSEASRSLALFSNTPEYETRRALMISLQNQLEAALSSALVAAINKRDVTACKGYYDIFSDIQREVEFRNYYFGNRRKALVESWSTAKLSDCEHKGEKDEHEDENPLSIFLKTFFIDFSGLLVEERSYTVKIFPDPQATLSSFVQSTIDALNPSLSQRLASISEHYGSSALPHLIASFKLAEEFAVSTVKIMESAAYSANVGDEKSHGGTGGKSMSRRVSKRMSISRRTGSISGPKGLGDPIGGTGAWEQALFEPFIDFQSDYPALERRYLKKTLEGVSSSAGVEASTDGARLLRERSATVFDLAEETLERCMTFTHGYGALGFVGAFDAAFALVLEGAKAQVLAQPAKEPKVSTTGAGDYGEIDYTSEDWEGFQQSLHILETCRAMQDRLRAVDVKSKATLLQFAGTVQLSRIDPTGLFVSGSTKGEIQLLTQSSLNSLELQSFLDGLIRDSQQSNANAFMSSNPNLLTPANLPPSSELLPPDLSKGHVLLLKGSETAIKDFTKATQLLLQTIILSPLLSQLSSYAQLSWTSQQRSKSRGGATFDLSIPTFSLSPTSTIQQVGEGLLNLPRMFDVHADDDALAFSIETLPYVDVDSLKKHLAGVAIEEENSPRIGRRRLSSSASGSSGGTRVGIAPPLPLVLTPEMVSSTWVSSLSLSTLAHLTTAVLPTIKALSTDGSAQLASDLGYLSNIVRSLNVEWEELERWKELSELNDEQGVAKLKEVQAEGDVDHPLRLMARMRSWRSD